ncbi:MAG TPA: hypothetical protein PLD38_10160 [Pyrinomonadaceae bacterium]|nr:hypothetical protein [Chloracidobacterium sp.]MBP9936015.1 hypothetical protein [Pyrinomonadaceae bacterium]MBK7803873.1 hypothetical protein [Chloracidobacterium sp.]MBK9439455.1 hypothetical protein [Chloracidobacterium sp.]MBK9768296.1 hypothetical protein [Chloracidobacterium sp.]
MGILVGIDGTGSAMMHGASRNAAYDVAFADSFVRRLCNGGGPHAKYFRGPVALGGGLLDAINGGFNHILSMKAAGVKAPVLLTGYSRGAAGVTALAKKLKGVDISVRALLLFDCVDRHLFIDSEVIPNNVEYVFHVVRDPDASSRESFGNDAMRYRPPTVFPTAYKFMCTHGGMGGCPWTPGEDETMTSFIDEGGYDGMTKVTYKQDAYVSGQIWRFVQPFVQVHGFV